jgi:predicted Zn-dependent peptidase
MQNNIKTLVVPTDNKKVISIIYKIKCGFSNETKGINNYTHLLEHLIGSFLNTKQCSMEEIRKYTEYKILRTNAYTNDNEVGFWIECYYKDADFYIDLMARSLFNLCITTENLDMAKKNVIKELEQNEDVYLVNDINTYFYKRKKVSYKYGIEDVRNATLDTIESFYKKVLCKEIIVGVACYSKYVNNIKSLIIKHFDKPINLIKDDLSISFKGNFPKKHKIIKHFKPIKSLEVVIIIPIKLKEDTKEYYGLMIALKYLFCFDHGVMYDILRNKNKLIYGINYSIIPDDLDDNKSYVKIKSYCNKKDLKEFLRLFYEIFNRYMISQDMFDQYKQRIIFKMNYNYMNNLDSYLNYYMDCIFYNRKIIKDKSKYINSIKYRDCIKILKEFKTKKHLVFLYNKSYKKQKD